MGSVGAKQNNATAYKEHIQKNGIPAWFYRGNMTADDEKLLFRTISEYGKLTKEERQIYKNIQYNKENGTLWYAGHTADVSDYTDKEIDGRKKFMAHSITVNSKNRR